MKTKVYAIFTSLSFFLFVLALGITLVSQDTSYYDQQLVKNETSRVTGLPMEDLQERAYALRDYLEEGDNQLISPFFNQREVRHMEDVHGLFQLKNWILVIAGFTFLGTFVFQFKREKAGVYLKTNLVFLLVFLLLMVFAGTNFELAFTRFHEIFFQNDLWLLNPETDVMIQMLPQSFFEGMALRIGLFVLLMEGVYLLALWRMTKKA